MCPATSTRRRIRRWPRGDARTPLSEGLCRLRHRSSPGVPDPLGGSTIAWNDDDTLLIAGGSEDPDAGSIYSIPIKRDACGHILAWDGIAALVAHTPYVDANLVYMGTAADAGADAGPLMLYSEWPNAGLGELLPGGNAPALETDL